MLFTSGASRLRSTPAARRLFSRAAATTARFGGSLRQQQPAAAAAAAASPNNNSNINNNSNSNHQQQQQQQPSQPQRRFVHVEQHLRDLNITLPKAAGPRANYDVVCHDEYARVMYVSGHLPFREDGTLMTGRITTTSSKENGGRDVDYGYQAARHAALNIIATLSDRLDGDLDRIEQIQKVFGIVQSSDDFKEQHLVMDGASDLFMEIFGDTVGYHARSAIGTNTLPLDITVEIECIVKLKPKQSLNPFESPLDPEICR